MPNIIASAEADQINPTSAHESAVRSLINGGYGERQAREIIAAVRGEAQEVGYRAGLRQQAVKEALLKLHDWDELIFGGFYCMHCTPGDADDPDQNVYWPCPSLRAVGVTDEEAIQIITAHRAAIQAKAAQGGAR